MEKNAIKSAMEEALALENQLLALSERSHELVRQLEMLLQSDELNPTPKEKSMPECLKRVPPTYKYRIEEVWQLLEKARKAGVLDDELQPLCTWQEASVLANLICDQLKISRKWRVFSHIWDTGRTALSCIYQQALKSANFFDIERRMLKIVNSSD